MAAAVSVRGLAHVSLPRALLFDLDDTILRESAGDENLWAELCDAYAPRAGVASAMLHAAVLAARDSFWDDPVREKRGRLAMPWARRAVAEAAFRRLALRDLALAHALGDAFTRTRSERMHFFPGAREALVELRARGHALALVTNGGAVFQREKIVRFEVAPLFDAIFVEGELGFGKPDPRVFQRALAALRAEPTEALMTGNDLRSDIFGAKRAGIPSVWVDHARAGVPASAPAQPDRVVRAIAELL
ncbi:MAG: HAD-IA family hydrolase [Deltaproteobacteria bacterium]|nr:HAD-IA family hydrolase [Deltaproteobacteria bacterium]